MESSPDPLDFKSTFLCFVLIVFGTSDQDQILHLMVARNGKIGKIESSGSYAFFECSVLEQINRFNTAFRVLAELGYLRHPS